MNTGLEDKVESHPQSPGRLDTSSQIGNSSTRSGTRANSGDLNRLVRRAGYVDEVPSRMATAVAWTAPDCRLFASYISVSALLNQLGRELSRGAAALGDGPEPQADDAHVDLTG